MGSGLTSVECSEQDTVNVSQEAVSDWLHSPIDIFMTTVVMSIICSLSLVTNMTFLFVMFRVPALRSDTNICLAHLAISDLLFMILAFGFRMWGYLASPLAFHVPFVSAAGCITFSAFINTVYHVSILLVTGVSFERYLALCHPIKHLQIRGRKRTNRMIGVCWLVGFILALTLVPSAVILNVQCLRWPDNDAYHGYPSSYAYCGAPGPWVIAYAVPLLNLSWLLLLVANNYMYVRIIITLNQRSSKGGVVNNDPSALKIRNQVAKMLVINGVVFFLCQTPYRIFYFSRWICSLAGIPDPLAAVGNGNWIGGVPQYINTMINPLIYGAINKQYRTAFRQAFRCKRCSRTSRATFTTSAKSTAVTHSKEESNQPAESTRL